MAKIDYENLRQALEENNEWLKQYVYDVITNFSPTSVNVARILSHLTNTAIHVTPDDKALWDSAYDRAVEYADEVFKSMTSLEFRIVTSLPTTDIRTNVIYLKETNTPEVYEQFVYVNGEWKPLGTTSIDMSKFYTKEQVDTIIEDLRKAAQHNHANKAVLDLVTAAFTIEEKRLLEQLSVLDPTKIVSHIKDTSIHLTEQEKDAISELLSADLSKLVEHISNTSIHLTAAQVQRYNGMLQQAKNYTDESLVNAVFMRSASSLPSNPDLRSIYFVPAEHPSEHHLFDKYIYINGAYESLGGGDIQLDQGLLDSVDFSRFVTKLELETVVSENSHEHTNKHILDATTEAFTTHLREKYDETSLDAARHIADTKKHLSDEQIALINQLTDLRTSIRNIVKDVINESNGDIGVQIFTVAELPTVLSDVNKNAIYMVPDKSSPGSALDSDADISGVPRTTNYTKYKWSNEFNCWEVFHGASMELSDAEIQEILS